MKKITIFPTMLCITALYINSQMFASQNEAEQVDSQAATQPMEYSQGVQFYTPKILAGVMINNKYHHPQTTVIIASLIKNSAKFELEEVWNNPYDHNTTFRKVIFKAETPRARRRPIMFRTRTNNPENAHAIRQLLEATIGKVRQKANDKEYEHSLTRWWYLDSGDVELKTSERISTAEQQSELRRMHSEQITVRAKLKRKEQEDNHLSLSQLFGEQSSAFFPTRTSFFH